MPSAFDRVLVAAGRLLSAFDRALGAFDRALALIASKGKWASAWNNDGQSLFPKQGLEPDSKDYSHDSCSSLRREWMQIAARVSVKAIIQPFVGCGS